MGNEKLMAGILGDRIRAYVRRTLIYVLCGSAEEYRTLFPKLDARLATPEGFRDHPIRSSVPYALITFAENGMSAHWNGDFISTPSVSINNKRIINTSGVGDAAAGSFCAGILDDDDPTDTLRRSARVASAALLVLHPQLLRRDDVTANQS